MEHSKTPWHLVEIDNLREQLIDVKAQRDQLAEALEGMLQIYGGALDHDYLPKSSVEMDCIDQARSALAAVNGE